MQLLSGSVLAKELFHFVLCLFGVRWNVRLHRLQFVPLGLWLCWFVVIWLGAARNMTLFPNCKLECLIAFSMFVTVTIAHGIILLNTFLQRRTHRQLELRLDVSRLEVQNQRHVLLRVSGVVVPFLVIQTLIVWSKIGLASQWYTPIFWFSSPSDWGVQLKMIAFLADVLLANERVLCVQQSLKQLARQPNHGRQSPNVVSVIRFKEMYRELHQLFVQLNFAYGGSLLIIFIVLFFNFLFNSFWLVRHTLTRLKRPVYIYIHLGSLLNLGLLLSATCWHCQQSFNHVRHNPTFDFI